MSVFLVKDWRDDGGRRWSCPSGLRFVGVPSAVGELVVAGPTVARGYLNRPTLTADKFRRGVYLAGAAEAAPRLRGASFLRRQRWLRRRRRRRRGGGHTRGSNGRRKRTHGFTAPATLGDGWSAAETVAGADCEQPYLELLGRMESQEGGSGGEGLVK